MLKITWLVPCFRAPNCIFWSFFCHGLGTKIVLGSSPKRNRYSVGITIINHPRKMDGLSWLYPHYYSTTPNTATPLWTGINISTVVGGARRLHTLTSWDVHGPRAKGCGEKSLPCPVDLGELLEPQLICKTWPKRMCTFCYKRTCSITMENHHV